MLGHAQCPQTMHSMASGGACYGNVYCKGGIPTVVEPTVNSVILRGRNGYHQKMAVMGCWPNHKMLRSYKTKHCLIVE